MRGSLVVAFVCVLAGCAKKQTGTYVNPLVARASFDLQCPNEQLRFYWFDTKSFGVAGCNRRATYVETCHQGALATMRECTFVLNGAVEATPQQQAPTTTSEPPRPAPAPADSDLESPGADVNE